MFEAPDAQYEMTPFFEMTPDLVCIASRDGYFQKVNQSVYRCLGYDKAELFSRPISSFIHPEDKELTHRERVKLINGTPLINFQNRYITKQGNVVWLHWTSIYIADRQVVFAIAKDITERKLVERQVQDKYSELRELTTHFKQSIERDRKILATELHEQIAQLAAVIKMDMEWMMNNMPAGDANFQNRMEHAKAVTDLMIRTIGKVSFSISPNMVEDTGLHAAINALCWEFSMHHNIPCYFEGEFDDSRFTHEMKLDFSRICQEALRNINDNVSHVRISLNAAEEGDCLTITIAGEKINGDELFSHAALKDINSRAASINGDISVLPLEDGGSVITLLVAKTG